MIPALVSPPLFKGGLGGIYLLCDFCINHTAEGHSSQWIIR